MSKYIQWISMEDNSEVKMQPIDECDVDLAVNDYLEKYEKLGDVIGFRFIEQRDGLIVWKSGIYYVKGELVVQPQKKEAIVEYCNRCQLDIPKFSVIQIEEPFFAIFPLEQEDRILSTKRFSKEGSVEDKRIKVSKLRREIREYKECIVGQLREVADSIEAEEFSLIELYDGKLQIAGDQGNFEKHLQLLERKIQELHSLQN